MTLILGLIFLFLMSWWVISIVNSQKPRKNETFIGYIQRYDIDGEGYQAEVWEVTEEEDSSLKIRVFFAILLLFPDSPFVVLSSLVYNLR